MVKHLLNSEGPSYILMLNCFQIFDILNFHKYQSRVALGVIICIKEAKCHREDFILSLRFIQQSRRGERRPLLLHWCITSPKERAAPPAETLHRRPVQVNNVRTLVQILFIRHQSRKRHARRFQQ